MLTPLHVLCIAENISLLIIEICRKGNSPAVMDSISLPCLNMIQDILQSYKVNVIKMLICLILYQTIRYSSKLVVYL